MISAINARVGVGGWAMFEGWVGGLNKVVDGSGFQGWVGQAKLNLIDMTVPGF